MFYFKYLKRKIHYYLLDHKHIKVTNEYLFMSFMALLSAFIYSVGFRTFISVETAENFKYLATGGMSGFSQCIIIVCQIFNSSLEYNTMQSIFYFSLNIPLLIFSFWKIGWKFSLFTTLNVALTSILINFMPGSLIEAISQIVKNDILTRSFFAGLCTGLSSACAFKGNLSAGGVDVVAHYIASRKSTPSGRYIIAVNVAIVILFTALTTVRLCVAQNDGEVLSKVAIALLTAMYSVVYLFVSSLVIDFINVRNKKIQLQIITNQPELHKVIISNLPHSCTVIDGRGGMTGNYKSIIFSVISNSEVKKTVNFIKKVDSTAFIVVTPIRQVYGSFFISPIS